MTLTSAEIVSITFISAACAILGLIWIGVFVENLRHILQVKAMIRRLRLEMADFRRQLSEVCGDAKDVSRGLRLAGLDDTRPPVNLTPTDYL